MEQPIPVTIITGFLGAGKTTLLNHLIKERKNYRFAIIENEVGEINLDSEWIIGGEEEVFQITDGCLCCSLNVELVKLLKILLDRRSEFDHLIIETTGIADPANVAAAFLTDINIQKYFHLDAVICLIDALHIEGLLEKNETEAAKQLAFADVGLINKADLVPTEKLATLQQSLRKINPFAQFLTGQFGQIPIEKILNIKAFQGKNVELNTLRLPIFGQRQHGNITAQTYVLEQPFDFLKFRQFIQTLLLFQNSRIYRMKGILYFNGYDEKVIFQSVQQQMVFTKGSRWKTDELRKTQLVVIGNGLKKAAFEKRLATCFYKKN